MPLISKYAQERYRAINNAFAQDKIDRPKLYEEPINFRIGKAFVKLCYKKYPNSSCYKHFKEVGGGTESGYGYKIITKRGRRFKDDTLTLTPKTITMIGNGKTLFTLLHIMLTKLVSIVMTKPRLSGV